MAIPTEALYSLADTLKFMDYGPFDELDDTTPPVQFALYNTLISQAPELKLGGK